VIRAEKVVRIGNEWGIHSRVAARLAGIAASHGVRLFLCHDGEEVACDSILDVLALALTRGTTVGLLAEGARAESALAAAAAMINAQDDSCHDPSG